MQLKQAFLYTIALAFFKRAWAASGKVCGGVNVDTVGSCKVGMDAQVCYANDGSVLCTCDGEVGPLAEQATKARFWTDIEV